MKDKQDNTRELRTVEMHTFLKTYDRKVTDLLSHKTFLDIAVKGGVMS